MLAILVYGVSWWRSSGNEIEIEGRQSFDVVNPRKQMRIYTNLIFICLPLILMFALAPYLGGPDEDESKKMDCIATDDGEKATDAESILMCTRMVDAEGREKLLAGVRAELASESSDPEDQLKMLSFPVTPRLEEPSDEQICPRTLPSKMTICISVDGVQLLHRVSQMPIVGESHPLSELHGWKIRTGKDGSSFVMLTFINPPRRTLSLEASALDCTNICNSLMSKAKYLALRSGPVSRTPCTFLRSTPPAMETTGDLMTPQGLRRKRTTTPPSDHDEASNRGPVSVRRRAADQCSDGLVAAHRSNNADNKSCVEATVVHSGDHIGSTHSGYRSETTVLRRPSCNLRPSEVDDACGRPLGLARAAEQNVAQLPAKDDDASSSIEVRQRILEEAFLDMQSMQLKMLQLIRMGSVKG
jgi:hypothetical protein